MLSGVNVLMAIMIVENINNRKPEGRFSTFNLDIIEKRVHAGRPAGCSGSPDGWLQIDSGNVLKGYPAIKDLIFVSVSRG